MDNLVRDKVLIVRGVAKQDDEGVDKASLFAYVYYVIISRYAFGAWFVWTMLG